MYVSYIPQLVSHANCMGTGTAVLVHPPFWFKLKYLNN